MRNRQKRRATARHRPAGSGESAVSRSGYCASSCCSSQKQPVVFGIGNLRIVEDVIAVIVERKLLAQIGCACRRLEIDHGSAPSGKQAQGQQAARLDATSHAVVDVGQLSLMAPTLCSFKGRRLSSTSSPSTGRPDGGPGRSPDRNSHASSNHRRWHVEQQRDGIDAHLANGGRREGHSAQIAQREQVLPPARCGNETCRLRPAHAGGLAQ